MDNKENNKQSFIKNISQEGLKTAWKNLPLPVKLKILAVIGIVILAVIVTAAIVGSIGSIFLDYSNDTVESKDVASEYEEYWAEFCEDDDSGCTEEQIEAAKELKKSQEKFYEKLDKLVKKYSINKEQKYLVLTTIFYDYDIDDFTEGGGAFELDSTDEINYEVEGNVYKKEQDSLKELIKQFKVYSVNCHYTYKNSNNEDVSDMYTLSDESGKPLIFGFFDKAKYTFGIKPSEDTFKGFSAAETCCKESYQGTVKMEESTTNSASLENYYRYLRTSTYFDEKPHLKTYFVQYANRKGLDTDDLSTWPEQDLENVREGIIDDIKTIVADYMDENNSYLAVGTGTQYWWPIGSQETSSDGGVLIASGNPEFTYISSYFGMRYHPIHQDYRVHEGIDIPGTMESTNIIAALDGTVIRTVNACDSINSRGCGGGYGNYIEILDTKGNTNIYAHMALNTQTVTVGDTVVQGQVIGKVGSSGDSTGAHLHFTIKVNGVAVDPLDYVDPANPRPSSSADMEFNTARFTKSEYVAILQEYYSQDGVCNSSSSQYVTGCTSFKTNVLGNGAEEIYDVAASYNLNPELIVARVRLEGYSPGSGYNYFGYGCTNTGGLQACYTFSSFKAGVEEFFKNASQYSSLQDMMSRYAYLGDYWYTGVHWGWGGCAYASYIYPDGVPDRVTDACSKPDGTCTTAGESACVPTTQEDRDAYTNWQVSKMAQSAAQVFG